MLVSKEFMVRNNAVFVAVVFQLVSLGTINNAGLAFFRMISE